MGIAAVEILEVGFEMTGSHACVHLTSDSGVTGLGAIRPCCCSGLAPPTSYIECDSRAARAPWLLPLPGAFDCEDRPALKTRQASSCSPPERSGRGAPAVDDECPAGMCRVTIREVAGQARVSLGTVSNVLNGPPLVAAETRQRVLEVTRGEPTMPRARLNRYRPGGG